MPRADARRNRDLILATARKVFSDRGPGAPLDDIAREAGVGNATLYRHFATRRDLLIAVYADEVTDLTAKGEELLTHPSPAEALFTWLRKFISHISAKSDLARAIPEEGRTPLFSEWHDSMRATLSALLERAQQAGTVRPDLTDIELLTLANGIALAGAETSDRLLHLTRDGLSVRV